MIEAPLEPDTLYGWSVIALSEYEMPIASSFSPTFSVSLEKTQMPVAVPALGVRTVLFDDWEQTAPNVFERRGRADAATRLTFTKVDDSDPRAVLRAQGVAGGDVVRYPVDGRTWWAVASNETLYVATRRGDDVYLIHAEGDDEDANYQAEFAGLVVPELLENFEVDSP